MAGNTPGVGASSAVMPVFPTPNTVKRFVGSGLAFVWGYTGGPLLERTFALAQRTVVQQALTEVQQALTEEGLTKLLGLLGLSKPDETVVGRDVETDDHLRAVLRSMSEEEAPEPVPSDFKDVLSKKLDETTDIAIKMFLTQLIFSGENWKATFCEIYQTAYQRCKAGAETSLDEAFYKVFEETFFSPGTTKSLLERLRYWLHLTLTAPRLKRYGNEIMTHFKADLLKFLDRAPEDRVSDVFATVIKPLHEHMSAYSFYNQSLMAPGVQLDTSIDEANKKHFNALKVHSETINEILFHFAHLLVEHYTPTISWSTDLDTTLNTAETWIQGIYSSNISNRIVTTVKVCLIGSCFFISWAFEKALNTSIKWKLKRVVRTLIKVNLLKTGDAELKTHSQVQHFINLFLLNKLRAFNANGKSEDHAPQSLRSSTEDISQMQEVVRILFINIPLSIATSNPRDLDLYIHRKGAAAMAEQELYTLFINKFIPSVAQELLKGLEHLLYDDKGLLSEFVWYTARNLEKTMTTKEGVVTRAVANSTEQEMHKQLRMAVTTAVKSGVETALNPSKKYQDELDASLGGVRNAAETFLTFCQRLDISTAGNLSEAWNKLTNTVSNMKHQLENTSVPKIQTHGKAIFNGFYAAVKDLIVAKGNIQKARGKKIELEKYLEDELNKIADQIKHAQYTRDKIALLKLLSEKPWISEKFKQEISHYQDFLEKFLQTSPDKDVLKLDRSRSDEFLEKINIEKSALAKKITDKDQELQHHIQTFKDALPALTTWKDGIKTIPITPQDVKTPLVTGIQVLGLSIEPYAVPIVMHCLVELLNFRRKQYHWNGILTRSIQALGPRIF